MLNGTTHYFHGKNCGFVSTGLSKIAGWRIFMEILWMVEMDDLVNGHAAGTNRLEVPTTYKAYFLGLNFSPTKIRPYMVQ